MTFYRGTGMPDEMVEDMRHTPMWPGLISLAPTLAYDSAVMDDIENGGSIPEDVAARATRPGLVLVGDESPPFMVEAGSRLTDLLPEASHRMIEGQGHVVAPDVLAPVIAGFLRD